jgi:hypothetical protein
LLDRNHQPAEPLGPLCHAQSSEQERANGDRRCCSLQREGFGTFSNRSGPACSNHTCVALVFRVPQSLYLKWIDIALRAWLPPLIIVRIEEMSSMLEISDSCSE